MQICVDLPLFSEVFLINLKTSHMKSQLLLFVFIISSYVIFAQAPKYQTYTADLLIIATKNGDNIQWQNKDIVVTLSYKTGDLKVIINNSDFYNNQTNSRVKEDDILDNSEFIFTGNLPIDRTIFT